MEANKSDVTPSEAKPQDSSTSPILSAMNQRWAEIQDRIDAGPTDEDAKALDEMKRRNPAWAARIEAGLQKSRELGRKNQARKG